MAYQKEHSYTVCDFPLRVGSGPIEELQPARRGHLTAATMSDRKTSRHCQICGRILKAPADPLSDDCGSDCRGCIGEIEADMGDTWALAKVRKEFQDGLRPGWVDPGDL